jgi:DNA invertase Pin-like site-specific DNA recombinase
MTSAAKHFGLSSITIRRIVNKGIYNNFIFKFEPKDIRVWVYDFNKKLIKVFNTTKETSEGYNISRHILNNYIKSGKLYKKDSLYFYNISSKNNPYFNKNC